MAKFFHLLRPSYDVPSYFQISETFLNRIHAQVEFDVKNKINESLCMKLLCDGWTNIRGESIFNFLLTTPEPVFFCHEETKDNKHNGKYISDCFLKVIAEVGAGKIWLIVTDNAKNMVSAWKQIINVHPHISCVGCASHGTNLMTQDILKIPFFKNIIEDAKETVVYFKSHSRILSKFKIINTEINKRESQTLKLFSKTRWNGALIMLESLFFGKSAIQQTALEVELEFNTKIRRMIMDEEFFWERVELLIKVLRPLATCTISFESDCTTINEVSKILY